MEPKLWATTVRVWSCRNDSCPTNSVRSGRGGHQDVVALDRAGRRGQEAGRVVITLPEDHRRHLGGFVEVLGPRDPIPAQVRSVTDAGHHHRDMGRRADVAEEHGVVLELRAVHDDVTTATDQRTQQRGAGFVRFDERLDKILLRHRPIGGRLSPQRFTTVHGRQCMPRRRASLCLTWLAWVSCWPSWLRSCSPSGPSSSRRGR